MSSFSFIHSIRNHRYSLFFEHGLCGLYGFFLQDSHNDNVPELKNLRNLCNLPQSGDVYCTLNFSLKQLPCGEITGITGIIKTFIFQRILIYSLRNAATQLVMHLHRRSNHSIRVILSRPHTLKIIICVIPVICVIYRKAVMFISHSNFH